MIARQFEPIAELQNAFTVLTKNLTLAAIPTIAFVIVGGIFVLVLLATGASAVIATGMNDPGALFAAIGGAALGIGIALIFSIIVILIAQAAVIAASQAVWEGRSADLGSGLSQAMSRAGDLLLAGFVLAIICVALSWTFVGPLVLVFFMIYIGPAIVVGGESAFTAMGTSWRMSTQNFGPTFAAFAGALVVSVLGGIVNAIIGHVPIIGWIAGLLVCGFTTAYGALVSVRFYNLLRGAGAPLPVVAPPPPPPAV
jgi:hypothetical protein